MHVNPYPVRVCPDGFNVAVRNRHCYFDVDPSDPTALSWRATDGMCYSDRQVEDWLKMAPYPEVPATGHVADVVGQVIDGAALSRDIDPEQAGPIRDAIVQGLRLAGLVNEDTGSIGAIAAEVYSAWEKVYPPRVGHDRDVSKVPAMLAGLSTKDLEILALAMGDVKDMAWKIRADTMREQSRREQGITTARLNLDGNGHAGSGASIVIDGQTQQLPDRVEPTGVLLPPRIHHAIRALGYRPFEGMRVVGASPDDGKTWIEYDVIRDEGSDHE